MEYKINIAINGIITFIITDHTPPGGSGATVLQLDGENLQLENINLILGT